MAADSNTTAQPNSLTFDYHKPRTVEDVTDRNVKTIAQLQEAAKSNRSSQAAR
jgi:3-polyprenyl-4-hydroxybenzoate decarboxylase